MSERLVSASGPADEADPGTGASDPDAPTFELSPSREAEVGGNPVRRALPQRTRRTVGAWCFADHMGPVPAGGGAAGIGPHPHAGLHTVTWLVEGELLHRDSLGCEQTIRPGQLNLMTAGSGVSHAEEPTRQHQGSLHGIQLWVAQPEATRHGDAAFEHHGELPEVEVANGVVTVLVGDLEGAASPARKDTELIGADLRLRRGTAVIPLEPGFEHALVVLEGAVEVDGRLVTPGHLAYLGRHRHELALVTSGASRLLVLGGSPFESPIVMWWNFVGRSRQEMAEAATEWNARGERFGETGSLMARIPAPPPPWRDPVA
jgi:quercetin 2,3-dioxygenase